MTIPNTRTKFPMLKYAMFDSTFLIILILCVIPSVSVSKVRNGQILTTAERTKNYSTSLPNMFGYALSSAHKTYLNLIHGAHRSYNNQCKLLWHQWGKFSPIKSLWERKTVTSVDKSVVVEPSNPHHDQYRTAIDDLLQLAKEYNKLNVCQHWDFLGEDDNIKVWKLRTPLRNNRDHQQWPCILSTTTINLPLHELADVIMDSSKVTLFNKYSGGRDDVVVIGPNSKIVWSRTKIPFAIKPYDFSTLMHAEKSESLTTIVSGSVECPEIPPHPDYSRSQVIFGMNILAPVQADPSKTHFTTISHVKYSGIHPFLAWRSALQGSITYFKSLKAAIKTIYHY